MRSVIQHDWFGIDIGKVRWLCTLYEWDLAPIEGSWALSGRFSLVKELQVLGLVERQLDLPGGRNCLVKITQHGKEFLEKCYPMELLALLLRKSSVQNYMSASHAQNAASKLIKKLPLEVAPMFLVHEDPELRRVGQMIVERANRV